MPPKFSEHATQILSDFGFTEEEVKGLIKEATIIKSRLK
jgi:hypothetical protein